MQYLHKSLGKFIRIKWICWNVESSTKYLTIENVESPTKYLTPNLINLRIKNVELSTQNLTTNVIYI